MIGKRTLGSLAALAGLLGSTQAATLELTDGSTLQGDLIKIHEGVAYFETAFAGTLEIPMEQVADLSSGETVSLRTEGGEVLVGPVESEGGGRLEVASPTGMARTRLDAVETAWAADERDPQVVAHEIEMDELRRKWSFTVGAEISGNEGNTEEFTSAITAEAVLEGPDDRLNLYGSYIYEENDGVRTEDEQIGGVKYTNFFSNRWGWFIRQELERDTFEGVSFRSTTAGGLTYRFIRKERMTLEGSVGPGFRYEDYVDENADAEDFFGLDFELDFYWQFADWGELTSTLNYKPSVDDFSLYLFEADSGVNIPLGTSDFWLLRFGIENEYNSNPEPGRDDLDTEYYIRLMLNWN